VKQLERSGLADLVVLDAPATGHAMTFLSSAGGLLDAARSGPVRTQAADVVEMLLDAARTRVLLVTLPEEMPVSETVEAAYLLEDRVGVQLGPVVVNAYEELPHPLAPDAAAAAKVAGVRLTPEAGRSLDEAATFRRNRQSLVDEQVGRLARELPLPQLRLPRMTGVHIGPSELSVLAAAMAVGVSALPAPVGAT
jgi:anion-transporting  ArsA/GET3 family ATPase